MFSPFVGFNSKKAWKGYMGIQTRRRSCNFSGGLETNRKDWASKTEELIERKREHNRWYVRKLQASQLLEDVEDSERQVECARAYLCCARQEKKVQDRGSRIEYICSNFKVL
jgi:hypothetical protein